MLRALLSVRIICLILTMTSFNIAAIFLSDYSFSAHSHHTVLLPAQLSVDDSPIGEVASTAAEGRNLWEIQQQDKQVLGVVHSSNFFYSAPQKDHRLRAALVFLSVPARTFFPRKLSPPSATDEPVLS